MLETEVLFIQEVSGVCISPFLDTDELKMALQARKVSGAFEKRAPGGDIVLFSWARHFTLIVPLSTQVSKWVLVKSNTGVSPAMDKHPI